VGTRCSLWRMSRYWSDVVRQLSPYVPGEQPRATNLTKLNTNENPYPPSKEALAVLAGDIGRDLRLYPDPDSVLLRDAIAELHGLDRSNVFVGNGSDEVIAQSFMAFFTGTGVLQFPDVTYSFYPVYCQLFGIESDVIPLSDDFSIDLQPYRQGTGGIIFPNPNAPTGMALPRHEIEGLLKDAPDRLIVVDEAYVDFGAESAVGLVRHYENLLVVQTLSKSRSLAGLRVGFAMGQADLISGLDRVKNSYNSYPIDRIAERIAVAALGDGAYFRECRDKIVAAREWTALRLAELGFAVLPSLANFLFVRHPQILAIRLFEQLRERDVLVRHFENQRIEQYLRITIGTRADMQRLTSVLSDLVREL
jgi:histidinol-phosphate aminotransferase